MSAEGIGQFIGSLLRARPQNNPAFLQQVNAGLTPNVSPYLEPTSQLKRVFGNNADELNMAYAGITGRGMLESRDAMQKMQEANRLAKARDEAQAALQSQADYDAYTLDLAMNRERDRLARERDSEQFGTPDERKRKRQLQFDLEEIALNEAKNEAPKKKELQELALKEAKRKSQEADELDKFEREHPELKNRSLLNRVDPFMRVGAGDALFRPGSGESYFGPVEVETPGAVNQYGIQAKPTRRWMQPPSVGPNPAVYPGSLLRQNTGGTLQTGDVYDSSQYLTPTLQSWLRSRGGSALTPSLPALSAPSAPVQSNRPPGSWGSGGPMPGPGIRQLRQQNSDPDVLEMLSDLVTNKIPNWIAPPANPNAR